MPDIIKHMILSWLHRHWEFNESEGKRNKIHMGGLLVYGLSCVDSIGRDSNSGKFALERVIVWTCNDIMEGNKVLEDNI